MIPYVLLNIIVSAIVVVVILSFWQRRSISEPPVAVGDTSSTESVVSAPQIDDGSTGIVDSSGTTVVLAATDTPVPPEPTPEQVTHTVAAGESLGAISVLYDESMADIAQANGLSDVNAIFEGQVLVIPVGGLVEPTAVPTATPDAPPTPVPTVAVEVGESTIELTVTGAGDLATESVTIANTGGAVVELEGWSLADDVGVRYSFPLGKLFGGGAAITLSTRDSADTGIDYFMKYAEALYTSGETLTLRDASGNIQATVTVP